jgi:membrane protein
VPEAAISIIQDQVNRIAAKGGMQLSFAFALGLGVALWSANAGMKALIDALNVIYGEKEKRGFIKLNLQSLALTVGSAVVILPIILRLCGPWRVD